MRLLVLLAALALSSVAAAGDRATERYAPDQLQMAEQSLQSAREAALRGDISLAGTLASQASLDARLAWQMSDSAAVRGPAARIFNEASRLAHQAAQGN